MRMQRFGPSTQAAYLSTDLAERDLPQWRLVTHIMRMTTIYIDESGYTGDDLYNPDQPFFTIASSLIDDEEAAAILRRCFPRYQGAEFKFGNIWKRDTHRNGLRSLSGEIPAIADRLFLYIIDKRFSLIVKMFDYLLEPIFTAGGYDYYGNGYARRYMNTIHRDLRRFGGESLYDETASRWDAFARAPKRDTMNALRTHLTQTANSTKHPISTVFTMLAEAARTFEISNPDLETFKDSSEIQLTAVVSTVVHWRQQRPEDFHVVHDESSNFLRQRDVWETILRDECEPGPVIMGDGTSVEFPLRVRSTTAVRSHDSAAVQLCDVIAGLGAKAALSFDERGKDPFVMELIQLGAGELTHNGVRPHQDYADEPMPRRTGPDMLDQMVSLLEPLHRRRGN
ncbi:hypothetical protein A9D12_07480 [Erythrobacter neustonensis]|uniref:DUF3800 domain-containing protein n=2 Tax=Erythrobacter neustonensis TaxID=1112 RepID=A0A192D4J2_9SPHN|nr:hypothetical protein A9D12_07480 [Erythrobacter neustonensis]